VESDEWPLSETARDKRVARKCDESPGILWDGEDTRGCGGKEGWDGDTVGGTLTREYRGRGYLSSDKLKAVD
jgi:hypothetical protein